MGGAFPRGENSENKAGGKSRPVSPAPVGSNGMGFKQLGRADLGRASALATTARRKSSSSGREPRKQSLRESDHTPTFLEGANGPPNEPQILPQDHHRGVEGGWTRKKKDWRQKSEIFVPQPREEMRIERMR